MESRFIQTVGEINSVKVPSVGDILGDKLTAYAPNTTGIPYIKNGNDASMEIIKQLYDIARLFEKVDNLDITTKSFEKIAEVELSSYLVAQIDNDVDDKVMMSFKKYF